MSKNKHTDPISSPLHTYAKTPGVGGSGTIDSAMTGGPKGSLPTKPFVDVPHGKGGPISGPGMSHNMNKK